MTTHDKTFRGGDDWFSPTWPANPGAADVTEWIYHEATGLLAQKIYADGHGPIYTYDIPGRLKTRAWVRRTAQNKPLVTTYEYDRDTGEMFELSYSDSTPRVTFTFTRAGQQATVTDACGTRTFEYSETMDLEKENLPQYLGGRTITRQRDALGRDAGFTLGIAVNPPTDPEYWVGYGYEAVTGRFSHVASSLFPADTAVTYGYQENSDLLHTTTFPNGLVATKAYEPQRNLIDYVENKVGATSISKYDYENDAAGRRTARAQTGSAFAQPDQITWGYNARNEVTSGVAQNDPAYNFGYQYDPIGNRQTATAPQSTQSYASNPLNQYTGITTNGALFNPVNDDDGNMTLMPGANGTAWTLTWDGENRLIAAESVTTRLEMTYDHMSRRVAKKVYTGNPGNWALASETRFLYDDWNLIAELDALSVLPVLPIKTAFVWGLDLTQSLQGAGGVGGLLASSAGTGTQYFTFDANSNVSELVDSAGATQAHYDYEPFGGVVLQAGTVAGANKFKFSTKYQDDGTGLLYYGYRYYAPGVGRWVSRDPVPSSHQYEFSNNEPCEKYDPLGLSVAFFTPAAVAVLPNTPPLDPGAQGQFTPEHPEWVSIPHKCFKISSYWVLQLHGTPRGTIRLRGTLAAAQVPGSGVGSTPESGYEHITLLQHEWAHANIHMYLWNTAVLPMSAWFESQHYCSKSDCERAHQALDDYLDAVHWTGALEGEHFHDRVGQPRSSYYNNWNNWRTAAMNSYAARLATVHFAP